VVLLLPVTAKLQHTEIVKVELYSNELRSITELITESQNNWGWKRPLKVICTLPKQGHLELAAQDRVQVGLEYLQWWRLHSLSGKSVPVLGHPHNKKVFPCVLTEPPVFPFVPITSSAVTGNHRKVYAHISYAYLKMCHKC